MSSNAGGGLTGDVFRPPRRTGSAAMWMPPVAEDVTFGIGYAPRLPASAPDTSTILVVLRSGQRQLADGCTAAEPQAQAEDAIAAADRPRSSAAQVGDGRRGAVCHRGGEPERQGRR